GALVNVVANRPRRGLFQDIGGGKVLEPLGQVDGTVLAREPGHPADHRLRERVRASGRVHRGGSYQRKAPAKQPGAFDLPTYPCADLTLREIAEPDEVGGAPVREGDCHSKDAAPAIRPAHRLGLMPGAI